jgi:hypothetical protein
VDWISRAVGGWNVRMTLGGRRRSKFFADAQHGTKGAALRAAKAYRDELAALRASLPKPEPKPLRVVRQNAEYYQIRIPKPDGSSGTTEFSVRRHGPRKARQLAIAAYRAAAETVGQQVR